MMKGFDMTAFAFGDLSPVLVICIVGVLLIIVVALVIFVATRGGGKALRGLEARNAQLAEDVSSMWRLRSEIEQKLAVEQQKASRVPGLEAELAEAQGARAAAEQRWAVEAQKALSIPDLQQQVLEKAMAADGFQNGQVVAERELAKANEALVHVNKMIVEGQLKIRTLEGHLVEAAARFDGLVAEKTKLVGDLAASEETVRLNAESIVDLNKWLESVEATSVELQSRLDLSREAKAASDKLAGELTARLDEKNEASEIQRGLFDQACADLRAARQELSDLQDRFARLEETQNLETKQSGEKIEFLRETREQMAQQFQALSETVMKSHGETFSRQNKEQIDGLLAPLKDRLADFRQGLETAQTETVKERATLLEQIRSLTASSAAMSQETRNLTKALKGESQTQGAWGEMILSTILEKSGLRKDVEYVTQDSHSGEDGSRLRPDVVVNLPNAERIIVDSKVSLKAFENYVNCDDDAGRAASLASHLASLRAHVKSLSGKEYQNIAGNNGVNFVIMFVPIEGALALALQKDPSLTAYAAELHVAIATPTTLMMALRTVASLWQVERRNANAEAIAERAGKMYDKFVGFVSDMESIGRRLIQVRESYDEAMGKLSRGKGNLVGQVENLKSMGARTSKSLPSDLVAHDDPAALPALEHFE